MPARAAILVLGAGALVAADPVSATGPWTVEGRLGVYLTSVVASGETATRDQTIADTTDSVSSMFKGWAKVVWDVNPHRIEHTIEMKYGRQRDADGDWDETTDLIEYRGVAQRAIPKPHYLYVGWGVDTVFTGADNHFADPGTGRIAAGYGQRHVLQPERERVLDARAGVRAQKTWGSDLETGERNPEVGPEAVVRYEAKPWPGTSWYTQGEAFIEFDDLAHLQALVTAGLTVKVGRTLTVDLSLRTAHETRPYRDPVPGIAYNGWAWRQDTLVGLTWDF
jgi:hypothetical protein